MHIPDGYLGPQTFGAAYAVMVPLWGYASSRVRRTLRAREVPLMALGAAFCFVIMMFNIPIPGGTTGHPVGSVLVAILLGPWAAVVAVSVTLAIQALLFGDGGITALAANGLNMAVVMPFVGYGTFRLLAGGAASSPRRRALAAAVGGYVGLNAAALAAAAEFGIQPLLARDASGRALYCPFGLEVALPAMALGHLLLFGFVEAAVTGAAYAAVARADPRRAQPPPGEPPGRSGGGTPRLRRGLLALAALVLLSPLGLILPAKLGAGTAWGEWSAGEIATLAGYLPPELRRLGALWEAPLPDYALPGGGPGTLFARSLVYIGSGLLGAAAILGVFWLVRRTLARREPP